MYVVACVCSANRAVMVAKDKAAHTSLSCQRLEKNVTRLVTEREDLRGQLEGVAHAEGRVQEEDGGSQRPSGTLVW